MNIAFAWLLFGAICIFLEFILPGGIISFLGLAAIFVGALMYFGVITSLVHAFISFFILSLVLILLLRSFFMKYFEGDSRVQNVDEDLDSIGSIVEVVEDIYPHKEGRVRFRDTSWQARSDDELLVGSKAIITERDESCWVVKAI